MAVHVHVQVRCLAFFDPIAMLTEMTGSTPKLRCFQYSLRTLLLFVTLCAIPCSWLAMKIENARRQQKAIMAITRNAVVATWRSYRFPGFGWQVRYDWQSDVNGVYLPSAQPPGPT